MADKFLNPEDLEEIKGYVDVKVANAGSAKMLYDDEYKVAQIRDVEKGVEIYLIKETNDALRVQEYAKDDRGQTQTIYDVQLPVKPYVDGLTGDLTSLTTDNKTSLVGAINEVYEKSGEPFRVKNWAANNLDVTIPCCTTDVNNTQIAKMTFSIDAVEGADYQIVGMIAYEVFDAASGGQRINCWPVCQFTGNGQKELGVRWMCGGTTNKVAKRINAWVLLKHR